MEKEILTRKEVAAELNVSVATLRNWKIPFRKFEKGNKVFVLRSELLEFLKAGKKGDGAVK